MKRFTALILLVVLAFSLFACGEEQKAEKYCWNCDTKIVEGAIYCSSCGAKLSSKSEITTEKNPEENMPNTSSEGSTGVYCYASECTNRPNKNGIYCSEHACEKNGCNSEKDFLSNFCFFHKCGSLNCDNPKKDVGGYCAEHNCIEDYCTFEKTFNSHYCYSHACSEVGCENGRDGIGFYCAEHTCAKNGCWSGKSVMSDYCLMHRN